MLKKPGFYGVSSMSEIQDKWERRSAVRSMPRTVFDKEAGGYFYPISRQPLAVHPLVVEKGEAAIRYLLIQSLYKYSNDIASIETRVVNSVILKAIDNRLPINFTHEQKLNLYTIMIDEAYHAYVAYDSMKQVEEVSGVNALPLPQVIEIEKAIIKVKGYLDEQYHDVFDFICVCLAENTLTKEIVLMTDREETHPFFQKLMKDHLQDESRHSGIFYKLLEFIWLELSDSFKRSIGAVLADFIAAYLSLSVQIEFDQQILLNLNLCPEEVKQAIDETYGGFKLTKDHPMLKNILLLLDRTGLLCEYTLPQFKEKGWI